MTKTPSTPEKPDVNNHGYLQVGDGHKIYWEDWGNPNAAPIVSFHGGPGGGFSDSHKLIFDPERHRVIFFDQRGSGRSTPFAETKANTTQHTLDDTNKLLDHLGIKQVCLAGGSWGSTLCLTYAIANPKRVKRMVMWGIYLARPFENDLIAGGHARYHYPEAWVRFIQLVPEEHRASGDSITEYYAMKIHGSDKAEAQRYADEWTLWEATLLSVSYDQRQLEQSVLREESNLAVAKLETQYFLNGCYLSENYILENIDSIKHIPVYAVQGRFDNCTPPQTAYDLAQAYGKNMTLQWVNSGHRRSDPEMFVALRTAINATLA